MSEGIILIRTNRPDGNEEIMKFRSSRIYTYYSYYKVSLSHKTVYRSYQIGSWDSDYAIKLERRL